MPKVILCSKCNTRKEVPIEWKNKLCPQCLDYLKRYREKHKSKLKTKREKKAILKSVRFPFMSFEDYKRYFPKSSRETYEEEKRKFEAQQRFISEKDGEIWALPCTSDLCYLFRESLLYGKRRSFELTLHGSNCRNCMRFYVLWKEAYRIEGVRLWHGNEEG